mgnify:CR=1 FL=1
MTENNFRGLKKWRRPEGRPISISGISVPDYTWSSVLRKRCAVPSEPPCSYRGASTATKITKLTFVASPFLCALFTFHSDSVARA